VAGSEFEIGLDTLIVAISQDAVLDLFGDRGPDLTPAGFIAVDPETFETSIPGVYAGGDVAERGPASIVRAAADGKRVAAAIAVRVGAHGDGPAPAPADLAAAPDVHGLVVRRARRGYRVPIRVSDRDLRDGFDETVLGYTAEEAMREAGRCLDCDTLCSLCVGVCPNVALLTYETSSVRADVPSLVVRDGVVTADGSVPFVVDQEYQVAVLTDLCNECGNCVTVCPTSGRPYVDKPRLYLDRADFQAQSSNAFMLLGDGVMEARFGGRTHRISAGGLAPDAVDDHAAADPTGRAGRIAYTAPDFRAVLDRDTFAVVEATLTGAAEGETLSLGPAAVMATLLAGVTGSLPHIPTVADGGATRVAHPGYAE
jgi:putative selenate reductase